MAFKEKVRTRNKRHTSASLFSPHIKFHIPLRLLTVLPLETVKSLLPRSLSLFPSLHIGSFKSKDNTVAFIYK